VHRAEMGRSMLRPTGQGGPPWLVSDGRGRASRKEGCFASLSMTGWDGQAKRGAGTFFGCADMGAAVLRPSNGSIRLKGFEEFD
jgi:hypothetical protein